jgi:PleD family two-component response regulator
MNEPQRFQKEDLFFYTALSSLASMAIENALLHSKSRQAEEALERARADLEIQVRERTTELFEANKRLEELSITDGLTGLHNYRYLMRVLDLRREVEKHSFIWQGTTVSIGVAAALEGGIQDWNGPVNAADQAWYDAKKGGRNRVIGWTPPATQ